MKTIVFAKQILSQKIYFRIEKVFLFILILHVKFGLKNYLIFIIGLKNIVLTVIWIYYHAHFVLIEFRLETIGKN